MENRTPRLRWPRRARTNSVIPPDAPPGHGPPLPVRSYIYKVPAAGSFAYICVYHSNEGMTGTIAAS
ncbi:MAG: hypothetical protein NVSMB4_19240 [Acidimicrobiales bacterium]